MVIGVGCNWCLFRYITDRTVYPPSRGHRCTLSEGYKSARYWPTVVADKKSQFSSNRNQFDEIIARKRIAKKEIGVQADHIFVNIFFSSNFLKWGESWVASVAKWRFHSKFFVYFVTAICPTVLLLDDKLLIWLVSTFLTNTPIDCDICSTYVVERKNYRISY